MKAVFSIDLPGWIVQTAVLMLAISAALNAYKTWLDIRLRKLKQ